MCSRAWRRFRFPAIALVALSILAQTSRAATEIPFENRAGMIWLKVSLTTRAEPLSFLLDSGAGAMAEARSLLPCLVEVVQ